MAQSVSARIQLLLALCYLRQGEREIAYEQLSLAQEDATAAGDKAATELISSVLGPPRGHNVPCFSLSPKTASQ